ncbi:MAG: C10 family peptidase [Tannerellaceae bacterium]|jgi:hypothetical protein|nr:C10 family peptidase [Tannerellaceae bacterium]
MKKKQLLLSMLCVGLAYFISCTQEIDVKNELSPESVNNDPVIEMIQAFADEVSENQATTRSAGANPSKLTVRDVKTETLVFNIAGEAGKLRTKASEDLSAVSVQLKTVTFSQNGKQGFSIASDDERLNMIYAFTESGSLADTVYNVGLSIALDRINEACRRGLIDYYKNEDMPKTKATISHLVVNNLIPTAWNQTAPYNLNAPAITCTELGKLYAGRAAAGCTAIAVAQAVAYLCPPTLSSTYNLPFLRQTTFVDGATTGTGVSNVASFVRYIGDCVGSSYGCSTGARIRNIRDEFATWGISYHFDEDENVNLGRTAKYLNHGLPTITRGERKSPRSGHAWLWTGIRCDHTGTKADGDFKVIANTVQLYCNWGWGPNSANGWFANYEQPEANMQPYLDNNDQLYVLGTSFVRP